MPEARHARPTAWELSQDAAGGRDAPQVPSALTTDMVKKREQKLFPKKAPAASGVPSPLQQGSAG